MFLISGVPTLESKRQFRSWELPIYDTSSSFTDYSISSHYFIDDNTLLCITFGIWAIYVTLVACRCQSPCAVKIKWPNTKKDKHDFLPFYGGKKNKTHQSSFRLHIKETKNPTLSKYVCMHAHTDTYSHGKLNSPKTYTVTSMSGLLHLLQLLAGPPTNNTNMSQNIERLAIQFHMVTSKAHENKIFWVGTDRLNNKAWNKYDP